MSSTRIRLRVAGLLVIASLVVACEGLGLGASDPPDETGASASTIALSGGATGRISEPGDCGKATDDDASWEVIFETDEPGWTLDATIEGTREPGTYPTGFHKAGAVTVLLYQGSGGASFDSSSGSGSITVDEAGDSGSIDATVTDATSGKTARAVGGWTCLSRD